jgi:hypothetical protein
VLPKIREWLPVDEPEPAKLQAPTLISDPQQTVAS